MKMSDEAVRRAIPGDGSGHKTAGSQSVRPVRPRPAPDSLTRPFWDAAHDGRLVVQRYESCGRYQHPPRPTCQSCGSERLGFATMSGQARLWSWTVTYQNVIASLEHALPYLCMIVELVEQDSLYMVCDRIGRDIDIATLRVGMPMWVEFPPSADGVVLPQFRTQPDGVGR